MCGETDCSHHRERAEEIPVREEDEEQYDDLAHLKVHQTSLMIWNPLVAIQDGLSTSLLK